MDKQTLRAEIRAKKRAMTPAQIEAASGRLAELLFAHPAYQAAKSLYGYLSYNQEVRTAKILQQAQKDGKRVAVFSDIDDTLVDGVHYTANVVGKNGDWNNAAFARFVMSEGCTALPGAVEFVKYCVDNGIEFFYVTNRYDQGYKVGQKDSKGGYDGKDGYKKADGTVIGTSTYDVFGKTFYDISYDSMTKLGFPLNADAHLITNDNKLNGSNKQPIRDAVANGAKAYLVNTGWNGTGKRISIKDTRGIIDAILSGAINEAPTKKIPYFDFEVPTALPGVDPAILDPRDTYADAAQWEEKAKDLAGRFIKNFAKYEGNEHGKALVSAGPQL